MNNCLISFLFLTCFFISCQPNDQHEIKSITVDTTAILRSIDTLAAKIGEAHAKNDAELFGSTWMEEGIMSLHGQPMAVGKNDIINSFKNQPELPPGADFKINPLEIKVINEEWAYAFGVDSLSLPPVGNIESPKQTFTFLVLLRKTPEGWKNYREVLSADQ